MRQPSKRASRALGLTLAGCGGVAMVAALAIGGWGGDDWGARTVPMLAAGLLAISGLAEAYTRPPAPRPNSDNDTVGGWRVAALLALAVFYVLAIDRVGYLVGTALVTPFAFALFGVRHPATLTLVTIGVPVVLHIAFFELLGVFPPYGRWFDLVDTLGL